MPIIYGFIDRLFFDAILKICKNIEKPANPSKNADIIICVDILLVCNNETEFTPLVSSNIPVITLFPSSVGTWKQDKEFAIKSIIFKLFNIEMIIENNTIKPPIKRIVEIALEILLLKIVPKSEIL